jgi:hypothetical protein
MNEPGRPEDTNSINFLLKDRYVKLRLDLNGGNNWLSKLLEPEDMNAFAVIAQVVGKEVLQAVR